MNEKNDVLMLCCFCGKYFTQIQIADSHINQCYLNHTKIIKSSIKLVLPPELDTYFNQLYSNNLLNKSELRSYNELSLKNHQAFKILFANSNNLSHYGRLYMCRMNDKSKFDLISNREYVKVNEQNNVSLCCCKCKEIFRLSAFFDKHFANCIMIDIEELSRELIAILNQLSKVIVSLNDERDYVKYLLVEYSKCSKDIFINDILCFICGASISLNSFEIHYSNCKIAFKHSSSNIRDEFESLEEPEVLDELLNKLTKDESISLKMIREYNNKAAALYKLKQMKRCSRCGKTATPNSMVKHTTICFKRKRSISKQFNCETIDSLDQSQQNNKEDKHVKRNRKTSMDHLKKITNEEVKYFKSLNFTITNYHKGKKGELK